jgi:uncharacterized protein
MNGSEFSLILLPTLRCNAACDYCFVNRTADTLSQENLAVIARRLREFMETEGIATLTIHWQGGEVMTLPPEWYFQARDVIHREAGVPGKRIAHSLQSNMLAYSEAWEPLIRDMFNGSVGSSVDYPNRHRRAVDGSPGEYNETWARNVQAAKAAGIRVGVICIPNAGTLEIGAERFYAHLVEELGLTDFQINTPFAGGDLNRVKGDYPLDPPRLGAFLVDLAEVWLSRGPRDGVRIGPFTEFLDHLNNETVTLPCIWQKNCAQGFVCIDPRGHVSQCDCWVASYPDYRFGNILESRTLSEILRDNPVRKQFLDRPGHLVQHEECIECEFLALCHGGCPIRTYTASGTLLARDPYCETYKIMFRHLHDVAGRPAPAVPGPMSSPP